ncbi:hypothetical protein TNCV_4900511 [Trichonephila clavipes]|nr:hypothetical protein TNCV_4900511 [Trichonephila clavipes]
MGYEQATQKSTMGRSLSIADLVNAKFVIRVSGMQIIFLYAQNEIKCLKITPLLGVQYDTPEPIDSVAPGQELETRSTTSGI